MKCYNHPLKDAEVSCSNCGKLICRQCAIMKDSKNFCSCCLSDTTTTQQYQPISGSMRFLIYVVSFIIMPLGLIIGVIFYTKPNIEYNRVGRNIIVISLFPFILYCVCFLAYFFFAFGGLVGSGLLDKAMNLPAY